MSDDDFDLRGEDKDLPRADDNVPWKRTGTPGWPGPQESKWGKEYCSHGASIKGRLFTDDELIHMAAVTYGSVPEGTMAERVAAMLWDYECNGKGGCGSLTMLINDLDGLVKTPHDRKVAEMAAATIIQWTQTNVGSGFLERVRKITEEERCRLQGEVERHRTLLIATGVIDESRAISRIPANGAKRSRRNDRKPSKKRSSRKVD